MTDIRGEWASFRAEALNGAHRGPKCTIAKILNEDIPAEERQSVRSVIEDPSLQTTSIYQALRKRLGDDAPTISTLGRHRRKECNCGKRRPGNG